DGNSNGISNGNYGKGASSGQNITPTSADVTATGVRVMKAYPTLAQVNLSATEKTLQTVSGATLYKYSVTANGGDVYLYKQTFLIGSSTVMATTTQYALYAYTDSGYSTADTTFIGATAGLLNAANAVNGCGANSYVALSNNCKAPTTVEIYMDAGTLGSTATTTYKIPAGETRWLALKADVSNVITVANANESINVQLEGDAAYPTVVPGGGLTGLATGSAGQIDTDSNNDFIWSPLSTTSTIAITNVDFTNAYSVVGLPGTHMTAEILKTSN
ncbi:MAG: hypothetical protein Q7R65_03920, partial [bacterium]|nr:hypothetical protein [bacterium]